MSRGIVTMAYGPAKYVDQAVSLATSLRRNCPGVSTALVTDSTSVSLAQHFDHIIVLRPELGAGMEQKLHLLDYTPFADTMYIDSDCLVVRDLDFLWSLLGDRPVGVVTGQNLAEGSWLGAEISEVRRIAGAAGPLPVFNGGLLYAQKSSAADAIFADARALMSRYAEFGFSDVRGRTWTASDEPMIGLALARAGLTGVNDRGEGMRTLIDVRRPPKINVITGESSVSKGGRFVAHPAVVHFAHTGTKGLLYRRECLRLSGWMEGRSALWRAITALTDALVAARCIAVAPAERRVRAVVRRVLIDRKARRH